LYQLDQTACIQGSFWKQKSIPLLSIHNTTINTVAK